MKQICEGPMIWFPVGNDDAAIIECSCGYLVLTGSFNDAAHADTPVLKEGLAA